MNEQRLNLSVTNPKLKRVQKPQNVIIINMKTEGSLRAKPLASMNNLRKLLPEVLIRIGIVIHHLPAVSPKTS